MGLEKLFNDKEEQDKINKKKLKDEHKNLDKKSTKLVDLIKRIEQLEKIIIGGDD